MNTMTIRLPVAVIEDIEYSQKDCSLTVTYTKSDGKLVRLHYESPYTATLEVFNTGEPSEDVSIAYLNIKN